MSKGAHRFPHARGPDFRFDLRSAEPADRATYAYDNLGRRSSVARGNGVGTSYGYDSISRLTSIAHNLTGAAEDVSFTLGYNPASQIVSRTISNDAYVFGVANQNTSYAINGRNEIVSAGGSSFSYDSNRNVTNDGTRAYAYDAANQMTSAGSTSFSYDPSGALYDVGAHRLASVGGERLALYTTSGGALHRRIVPGAGLDEAAAYYHGAGTTTRQWPLTDQLGSVIAYANASGAAANINTYDEYGRPGSGNAEFLQYTGQLAIASAPGVYNYRHRFYQADIGRFLQTDPIGYGAGLNLYAYVGNDPINRIDPWGLDDEIVVEGRRPRLPGPIIILPDVLVDDVGTAVTDADDEIVVLGIRRRRSPYGFGEFILAAQGVDRCLAQSSPPLAGQPTFFVDWGRLNSVAQTKFIQHFWPLRPDGRPQSTFDFRRGVITDGETLAGAAAILISTHSAVPAGNGGVRITGDLGALVGWDERSRDTTNYLTVVFSSPVGRPDAQGLVERLPVSMYPGCP